jgi:hypothetical protein
MSDLTTQNKAAKVLRIIPAVDSGAVPIISRNYYAVLFSITSILML